MDHQQLMDQQQLITIAMEVLVVDNRHRQRQHQQQRPRNLLRLLVSLHHNTLVISNLILLCHSVFLLR